MSGVQRRLCSSHGQESWGPSLFIWWQARTGLWVACAEDKSKGRFRPVRPYVTKTYLHLLPLTAVSLFTPICIILPAIFHAFHRNRHLGGYRAQKMRPQHIVSSTQSFHLPHTEKAWELYCTSLSMEDTLASRNYQHWLMSWSLKAKSRNKFYHMSFMRF